MNEIMKKIWIIESVLPKKKKKCEIKIFSGTIKFRVFSENNQAK